MPIIGLAPLVVAACSLSAPSLDEYAQKKAAPGGAPATSGAGGRDTSTGGAATPGAGASIGGAASVGSSAAGSIGGDTESGGSGGVIGSRGNAGTGAGSGTGGSGCGSPPVSAGSQPLLDDFEDHDGMVANLEQRSGGWFTYNDTSGGTQLPATAIPLPVASDRGYSMNTSGSGFTSWGAGIGVVLNDSCPYNAAVYQGLKFQLKGSVNSAGSITVRVRIAATTPSGGGGTCTVSCFDHYSTVVGVSPTWTEISIPWTMLKQAGAGTPTPFQADAIIGANFETSANQTFDIWLDDVSFF